MRLAQDYLTFTEIKAPFSGRVSRRNVDPGNLVKADETVLTTLVAEEPIWANFDVDERTLLRQLMKAGKLEVSMSDRAPVAIGLADEEGFPHTGVVNFVDNEVDRGTGSMWMRAEFINPKRSIKPLIKLCGPVCGISRTSCETSTTASPFRTPSLKSSKNKNFIRLSLLHLPARRFRFC